MNIFYLIYLLKKMAELTFLFDQVPTVIQCSEKDLFKVAVENLQIKSM